MKKLLLVMLVSAMTFSVAVAQQPKGKHDHAAWDQKVKTELNLTTEQAAKYDALSSEYKTKIDALEQDANLSKDAIKERKMILIQEKESRLAEFLTAEQQAKYKDLMNKKKKEKKS